MKLLSAIFFAALYLSATGQVFDFHSPEERARDERSAVEEKAKASRTFDYTQIYAVLVDALGKHAVVEGVDLSLTKLRKEWDWKLDSPYANPQCGDWEVAPGKGGWTHPESLQLTVCYDPRTKRIDPNARNFVAFDFDLVREEPVDCPLSRMSCRRDCDSDAVKKMASPVPLPSLGLRPTAARLKRPAKDMKPARRCQPSCFPGVASQFNLERSRG